MPLPHARYLRNCRRCRRMGSLRFSRIVGCTGRDIKNEHNRLGVTTVKLVPAMVQRAQSDASIYTLFRPSPTNLNEEAQRGQLDGRGRPKIYPRGLGKPSYRRSSRDTRIRNSSEWNRILSRCDHLIFAIFCCPRGGSRPAVMIAHGMHSHGGRWSKVAHYYTEKGYLVFANDHVAHGL